MDGQSNLHDTVEAPRGTLTGRVDEKGRLKLPSSVAQYFGALGEQKVFITTLDESSALIYPISVWKETEKMLEEPGEDADLRADVALVANHYGEDAEIDGQGRLLLPTTLRRELGLERDDVYLSCYKQRVEVFGSKVYRERFESARADIASKVNTLRKKGLR